MPPPNPYPPPDGFAIGDWQELLANRSPNSSGMFSTTSGEAGLVGQVLASKSISAMRYMLGYSNVTTTYPYTLQRSPPVYHPKYTGMICRSVADDEFKPNPVTNSFSTLARIPASGTTPGLTNDAQSLIYRTSYLMSRLTMRFAPVPYPILSDGHVIGRAEWTRYCYIDQSPKAEILALDGFQMVYTEGVGNTDPPVSNPQGKPYPGSIGQVLVKSDLRVTWEEVPEKYIMDTGTVNPSNILDGLGCVNKYNWNNYTAGTLLLNGVMLERFPWALCAGVGSNIESAFNYRVTFMMSFFDPPKGYTGNSGTPIATNRGHNNFPWRGKVQGTVVSPTDTNAGKWFYGTYDGTANGNPLFQPYDFSILFDSPQNYF